jgi:hypothetical protein
MVEVEVAGQDAVWVARFKVGQLVEGEIDVPGEIRDQAGGLSDRHTRILAVSPITGNGPGWPYASPRRAG